MSNIEKLINPESITPKETAEKKETKKQYLIITLSCDDKGDWFMSDLQGTQMPYPAEEVQRQNLREGVPYNACVEFGSGKPQFSIVGKATNQDFYDEKKNNPEIAQLTVKNTPTDSYAIFPGETNSAKASIVRLTGDKSVLESGKDYIGIIKQSGDKVSFQPLLEAYVWENKKVEPVSSEAGTPALTFYGQIGLLEKSAAPQSHIYVTSPEDLEKIKSKVSRDDYEKLRQNLSIYLARKEKEIDADRRYQETQKRYQEALKAARAEAWANILSGEIDWENNKETGNREEIYQIWQKTGDIAPLIQLEASKIIRSEDYFLQVLKEIEGIDLSKISDSKPATEKLPFGGGQNLEYLDAALLFYRKNRQTRKVNLNLGKLSLDLTYTPQLRASNSDWSTVPDNAMYEEADHQPDTTSYRVKYCLADAVIKEWPNEIDGAARVHLERLIQQLVDRLRTSGQKDSETDRYCSGWIDDYDKQLETVKQMSVGERRNLLSDFKIDVKGNKLREIDEKQPEKMVLWERNESASDELKTIMEKLPVANYGQIDKDGEIIWFGLPVNRSMTKKGNEDGKKAEKPDEKAVRMEKLQKESDEKKCAEGIGLKWSTYSDSWDISTGKDFLDVKVKLRGDNKLFWCYATATHPSTVESISAVIALIAEKKFILTKQLKKDLINQAKTSNKEEYVEQIEQLPDDQDSTFNQPAYSGPAFAEKDTWIGASTYSVNYRDSLALGAWLDQHGEYLKAVIRQQELTGLPEAKIEEPDKPIEQLEEELAKKLGLERSSYNYCWQVSSGTDILYLSIGLRGDYKSLRVRVEAAHTPKINDISGVINLIEAKKLILTRRMKEHLIDQAKASDKEEYVVRINQLPEDGSVVDLTTDLPFLELAEQIDLSGAKNIPDKEKRVSPEELFKKCSELFNQYKPREDSDPKKEIKDYYSYYGLSYDDSRLILDTLEETEESLNKHVMVDKTQLELIKKLLETGLDYSKKLHECCDAADKKIAECYSNCPLCGEKFQESKNDMALLECLRPHDVDNINFPNGPAILSEILTDRGKKVAQLRCSKGTGRVYGYGDVYLYTSKGLAEYEPDDNWKVTDLFNSLEFKDYFNTNK